MEYTNVNNPTWWPRTVDYRISAMIIFLAAANCSGCSSDTEAAPATQTASSIGDATRYQLIDVLNLQYQIAGKLSSTNALDMINIAQNQVKQMTSQELASLADMQTPLSELRVMLEILNESLNQSMAMTAAETGQVRTPRSTATISALSTPLTPPNYFNDPTCPLGERFDNLLVFISEQALFVAEEVREIASRGCNQMIVVLGEGANLSTVCITTDVVYIVAKQVHNVLSFCDATVNSAEIEGAFERTADIYSNLNEHDTDIKNLLMTIKAGQRQIMRLLLTPEGRREIDPNVITCTGDNCPIVLDCPGNECAFPIKP